MIKKLRIKFILLSTISLLLLLGIIVISSSLLTYRELVSNADRVLEMIVENGGSPPHKKPHEKPREKRAFLENADNRVFSEFWEEQMLSPEQIYEARFFMADISSDGQVLEVNTESIMMVDDEDAQQYARLAQESKSTKGFLEEFRFTKILTQEDIHIIFLDCGRKLYTFKITILIHCLISFAGFLGIFIIIVFFSKKIVQPVSESYERQKQFIAVAGHELKTPITIIDADAEVLSMEIEGENEWIQDICAQTRRMTALTNDLICLSRMDEHRQQFSIVDFPISDVVGETASSFQTLAHSMGMAIHTEITPMLCCHADEGSVRQITSILLDNAIKYTKPNEDGSFEDILLKLEKKSHTIILSVKNHAQTIDEEQLGKFFDRFYRTEQSRNSEKGGYGLGLSIAKAMVEAQKGRIVAAAPDLESVQITVMLPAGKLSRADSA